MLSVKNGAMPDSHLLANSICFVRGSVYDDSLFHRRPVSDFDGSVVAPQDSSMPDITVISYAHVSNNLSQFTDIRIFPNCRLFSIKFIEHQNPFSS